MNKISLLLEGKKTYIGIIVIIAGCLGLGDILTPETVSTTVDSILKTVGIIITIYGRYAVK